MANPKEVADAWTGFDVVTAFDRAITQDYDVQQDALDINKAQMRLEGRDADGKRIKPLYSDNYRKYKKKKGSRTNPTPDLYDTGAMHDEMFIKHESRGVFGISSPTPYTEHLEKRYGNIFGISPSNMKIFKKSLLPEFNYQIKKSLKLI